MLLLLLLSITAATANNTLMLSEGGEWAERVSYVTFSATKMHPNEFSPRRRGAAGPS